MKKILIIGGTDGIGRALADHLALENHVLIIGRSIKKGEEFMRKHPTGRFIQADVSLLRNIPHVTQEIQRQLDRLDWIIHTADILRVKRLNTSEGLETSIAINYYSRVLFNFLLMELYPANQIKHIIHIAAAGFPVSKSFIKKFPISESASSFTGHGYGQVANDFYGIYKKKEFEAKGIQINILNPGIVDTDIRRNGQFPAWFSLLAPVMGLFLKPVTRTPLEYAKIPLAILNEENQEAKTTALINSKGKMIKGNKVLNDMRNQQYIWQNTSNLIKEVTGVQVN